MNPAERVIEKCGGHSLVAEMLGVHVSRVHRWTYPKERGGSDGVIPGRHIPELIAKAADQGITLSPGEFYDLPEAKAS